VRLKQLQKLVQIFAPHQCQRPGDGRFGRDRAEIFKRSHHVVYGRKCPFRPFNFFNRVRGDESGNAIISKL